VDSTNEIFHFSSNYKANETPKVQDKSKINLELHCTKWQMEYALQIADLPYISNCWGKILYYKDLTALCCYEKRLKS